MYCDRQEFMTSMSIEVEKVGNPLYLDELLDLPGMLLIIRMKLS